MPVLAIRQTPKPRKRKLFPVLAFRKVHLENGSIVTSNTCKEFNLRFSLKLDYYEAINFPFFTRWNLPGNVTNFAFIEGFYLNLFMKSLVTCS